MSDYDYRDYDNFHPSWRINEARAQIAHVEATSAAYNSQQNAFAPTLDQRVDHLEARMRDQIRDARSFTRADFLTTVATSSVLTVVAIVALTVLGVI